MGKSDKVGGVAAALGTPAWVRTGEPLLWLLASGHAVIGPGDGYFYDCRRRSGERQVTLQLTLAGAGFFESGGKRTSLLPGMAFVHEIGGDFRYGYPPGGTEKYEQVWLSLQGPEAERWCRRITDAHGHVLAFGDAGAGVIAPLMLAINRQRGLNPDRYVTSSRLYHLLMTVLSVLNETRMAASGLAARAIPVLHERAGEVAFTVAELAERVGCSREHLAREFRAATGVSPSDYLVQHRLRLAGRALRETEQKLEQVARQCGFSGANYFCRLFRTHVGMTPAEFRKRPWVMVP